MSVAVIACGALAAHVHEIADRCDLDLHVEPINPLLHNRPEGIAPEVEKMILELQPKHNHIAIAYADCGTYGALDELCKKYDLARLAGDHCYDVFATAERMKAEFEKVPGTYVFTDYLVKTFRRSVMNEMGLDRYPELRDDYFHSYKRVLWLAQHQTAELEAAAKDAAELIGLPLEIIHVGDQHLEEQLLQLIGASSE
ncbi:unannotated protein [freshwater metagenome]|jgi:hypothetical protein|uniref:Unannotated protein n=1 Tax=freshwater metagenome TaxID=449393 RepID=A0A6J6Y6X6_9ZZZZ|nr:DUF1638 domain-containing protein [Actinomycetota bacterium]MSW25082.1 DUF1638 domain-containing protein [Actinomycetota bacterium]MSX29460.1 DUF1638 domain-containing protein [Actinomycetota bacterium]MSX43874.1 DUF1638 domain-containing protein [Actinomycetota bacterium]MSX97366.1 DUF1638 domain-containing protein [Actinomycetota bacterium]